MLPQRRASVGLDTKENRTPSDPLGRDLQAPWRLTSQRHSLEEEVQGFGQPFGCDLEEKYRLLCEAAWSPECVFSVFIRMPIAPRLRLGQSELGEAWGLWAVRA